MMKLLAVVALLAGVNAQAKSMSKDDMSNGGYGTAGCGLGALVFGNKEGPVQIIASTLNGTGVQTFGMTTGTSNCGSSVFSSAETKAFIDNNPVALQNDIVRGQGETLTTLAKMLKCDESQLSPALKSDYKSIYSGSDVSGKIMETASAVCSVKG